MGSKYVKVGLGLLISSIVIVSGCEVGTGSKDDSKVVGGDKSEEKQEYMVVNGKSVDDKSEYGKLLTASYIEEGLDDYSNIYQYMLQKYGEGVIREQIEMYLPYYQKIKPGVSDIDAMADIERSLAINEMLKRTIPVDDKMRESYGKEYGSYQIHYMKDSYKKVQEYPMFQEIIDKTLKDYENQSTRSKRYKVYSGLVTSLSTGDERVIYLELTSEKIKDGEEFEVIYGDDYYKGKVDSKQTTLKTIADIVIREKEFVGRYKNDNNTSQLYGYIKRLEKDYPKDYKISKELYTELSEVIKAKYQGKEYEDVKIDIVSDVSKQIRLLLELEGERIKDEENRNSGNK